MLHWGGLDGDFKSRPLEGLAKGTHRALKSPQRYGNVLSPTDPSRGGESERFCAS